MNPSRQLGCIFCDIIAGDIAGRIVSKNHGVTAFLPDEPATRGHVLVVPDDHVADVWGLSQGATRNLSSEVLRIAGGVRDAMSPDGLNVIQSNGAAASQTVDHLHVHVLPRWTGDIVGDIWPVSPSWSNADLDLMRSDLAKAVAASSPAGYDLSNDQDREDRRKHLDLISGAIGRMAGSSAAAKGWSVTLAGAAFGLALARDSWPFIVLGALVLVAFGALDARYLDNERRARGVYNAVADDNSVVPLSLGGLATASGSSRWWWPNHFKSWSIWLFYGPLVALGTILLVLALLAGPAESPDDPTRHPSGHDHGR